MYTYKLITLGIFFLVKHVICDYFLQLNGESGRKRLKGKEGVKALLGHSFSHGFMTFLMSLGYFVGSPTSWDALFMAAPVWLGLLDLGTHFGIDFAKVKVEWAFQDKWGWRYLVIVDQLLHFVVTYLIIEIILKLA